MTLKKYIITDSIIVKYVYLYNGFQCIQYVTQCNYLMFFTLGLEIRVGGFVNLLIKKGWPKEASFSE